MSNRSDAPGYHSLTAEEFAGLARGGGDAAAIGQLVASQLSKHLILLGRVARLARNGDYPDDELGVAGQQLLARIRQRDAAAVDAVIRYPSVGAWALHTVQGSLAIPGARPSGLASIAAAAAIKAAQDIEVEVPVTNGAVVLPSVGVASASGSTAIVDTKVSEVRSGDQRVNMLPGAPGWQEIRRASVDSWDVVVDDLDPFRMPATDGQPSQRLTTPRLAELRSSLSTALLVLSPVSAAEVAAMVQVIVPYEAPGSGRVSTSSPQAFGTVAMSRQPDRYTCAETLIHETQHLKLGALLDVVALTEPDNGQLHYAPWRPDPRPVSGLLQGAYAFLGVSGFWREQCQTAPELQVRQHAQAEFARWREGVAIAVQTLLGSGQLTRHGRTFVKEMGATIEAWRREPVPGEALLIARHRANDHRAQWQLDNAPADPGLR